MLTIFIKCIVLFALLLVVVRIMGKRQIGEMQPFEFVITLIVAEVVCIPMTDPAIPLSYGIIPVLTLTVVQFFISFVAQKSLRFRKLISGKPIIVITPEGIDYKNLKKLNMTMNDLLESCRGEGYFHLEEIHYALFETNGKLCVIAKSDYENAKNKDLGLKPQQSTLSVPVVIDGKFVTEHLKALHLTESLVQKHLSKSKIHSIKDVSLVMIDNNGAMYIQQKDTKFLTSQM